MDEGELEKLSLDWVNENLHRRNQEYAEPSPDSAIFYAMDLVDEDISTAWKLIKRITELSDDDWVMENLGAGNFETLVFKISIPLSQFFELEDLPAIKKLLPYAWLDSLPEKKKRDLEGLLGEG